MCLTCFWKWGKSSKSPRAKIRFPMSAQSTFSQTPAYSARLSSKKEQAAAEALVYEGPCSSPLAETIHIFFCS